MDGLGLDEGKVTAILGGLAICDDTLDLDEWNKMRDETYFQSAMYTYIRQHMPSVKDFLPTNDIPLPYLVKNQTPYNQNYPYGQPPSTFLEDLNNTGGDYEVNKLQQLGEIIASFSTSYPPEGQYKVAPPPTGVPWTGWWGRGEVIGSKKTFRPSTLPGDNFVPAYSADLKAVTALSNSLNLVTREENAIVARDGQTLLPHHISLVNDPNMIRRLVSLITVEDLTAYMSFWDLGYIQPSSGGAMWALITCSPVRTLVTAPSGDKVGLDLTTGQVVDQISNSVVSVEGTEPHLIILPEIPEEYVVEGIGTGQGVIFKIRPPMFDFLNATPPLNQKTQSPPTLKIGGGFIAGNIW